MSRSANCVWFVLVLVSLTGVRQSAGAAPADSFPCEARVVSAGAPVRSGPGENYYVTDTLAEGQAVEVYQQRPDGWCAIRPPESSFSWVFSRNVEPVGEGLGRINKDGAPSRVGSSLSSHRDVTQVELHKGEIVRVIDEETHDGQTWFKIAPPAGEFRWIHASQLQREGGTEQEATAADAAWRPMARSNQQLLGVADEPGDADVHLASNSSKESPTGDAKSPVVGGEQDASSTVPLPEEFARRIDGLELRLSRMVAEPTATWDSGQLKGDAERLLSQAGSAEERDAAQALLAKIDQFASIQRRFAQAGGNVGPAAQNIAITPVGTPNGTMATAVGDASSAEAGRFDAVGILRPVVSRRQGAPQFALVDERGQVVSFVTPSPDLNLQPYLGRRVGIVGTRGFMPEYRRNYVVAGRVSPLDSSLVR